MKHIFKSLVISFFLLGSAVATAQLAIYTKTISGFNSDLVRPGDRSSVFLFGQTSGGLIPLVSKIDSAGNIVWTRKYVIPNSGSGQGRIFEAVINADSTISMVGQTSDQGIGGFAFCIKIKSNGDTIWSKKLSDPGIDAFMPYKISTTIDSGNVITGEVLSTTSPAQRLFVTKINKNGNLGWSKTFSNTFLQSVGYAVKLTPDSGFVIVGSKQYGSNSEWNIIFLKLNKNGQLQWARNLENSTVPLSYGFDMASDNNSFTILVMAPKPILMKYSFSGNNIWTKSYNETTYLSSGYFSDLRLKRTSKSGYVIIYKGMEGGSYVLVVDSAGKPIWRNSLALLKVDAVQNRDKSFSLVGNRLPIIGSLSSKAYVAPDIQLSRVDSLGMNPKLCGEFVSNSTTITPTSFTTTSFTFTTYNSGILSALHPTVVPISLNPINACLIYEVGLEGRKSDDHEIELFPNPSSSYITLSTQTGRETTLRLVLQDLSGRILIDKILVKNHRNEEVDCSHLNPAVYLFSVYEDGLEVKKGKLVIIR